MCTNLSIQNLQHEVSFTKCDIPFCQKPIYIHTFFLDEMFEMKVDVLFCITSLTLVFQQELFEKEYPGLLFSWYVVNLSSYLIFKRQIYERSLTIGIRTLVLRNHVANKRFDPYTKLKRILHLAMDAKPIFSVPKQSCIHLLFVSLKKSFVLLLLQ